MSLPFSHLSLQDILNHVVEEMESMQEMSSKNFKTVIAWILCFLAALISSAGGVGGGALFLHILNLVAGLQIRTATTFSAFMVTGGSLTTVIYNLFLATSSLIDYEITLLSQPCLLLGVSVGVFFNIMFPEWLITVLFAAFLAFSTFKTCSAGVKYWKGETEAIRRSRDCGDDELSLEVSTAMGGEVVCAAVGTPWAKLVILVFVWLSFFGLHVLLGDKDGQSFIHIKPCAVSYWLIASSQIPLAVGLTAYFLYAKHRLHNDQDHHEDKHIKNIASQNRISTQPKFLFPVAALLSGIVGGLLGIGGGLLINPVLLQIGLPPQTTAATTCFMVLFSSSMSSAQYLILGMKGVKQALFYAQLCIVGSALGLVMMQKVVMKSGRASLIVFMVSIVMALSTISITSFGALDVWRDYTAGRHMGFKLPC